MSDGSVTGAGDGDPMIGTRIKHLVIEQRLGAGGMGEVYLARDMVLDRLVAVKSLRAEHRLSPDVKARFLREARLLSKLGDPAICQVYELIEGDDADYLVLEFVRGQTLRSALPNLAAADKPALLAKVARALAVAHREGIVHRDLKADNVMLTPDGSIKILDFGVARSVDPQEVAAEAGGETIALPPPALAEQRIEDLPETSVYERDPTFESSGSVDGLTQIGTVIGTLSAMSPEQAAGNRVTEASDLYSLGVLCQEVLTGRAAYGDTRGLHLWQRVLRGATEPVTGIDPDLAQLVRELLNVDPRQRPGAELVAARLGWIQDKPLREARQRKRRQRWTLVFCTLVLGLAITAWLAYTAQQARAEAERRRKVAEDLIGFMINDLRVRLEEVGRLDLLDAASERSLAYFEALPESELTPAELGARVIGLVHLASVRRSQGDLDAALAIADRASVLATAGARNREVRTAQLELLSLQGQLHFDRDELDEARGPWEEAVRAAEELNASHPLGTSEEDRRRIAWSLASSLHNLGTLVDTQGKLEAGAALLRRSLEVQHGLVDVPKEEHDFGLRSATLGYLSRSLEQQGDLRGSLEIRREYLQLLERGSADLPDNTPRQYDLAVGRGFLSSLEHTFGLVAEAEEHLRQGIASMDALGIKDPSNTEVQFWQVGLRISLIALLLDLDRAPEALTWVDQAEDLLRTRIGVAAPEPDALNQQASLLLRRAVALEQVGNPAAGAALERALGAIDASKQRRSLNTQVRLANAELVRGRLALRRAETEAAHAAWQAAATAIADIPRPLATVTQLETDIEIQARLGHQAEARASYDRLIAMGWNSPRRPGLAALLELPIP
jgi:tetratricopeptide (TPR) repeat protein